MGYGGTDGSTGIMDHGEIQLLNAWELQGYSSLGFWIFLVHSGRGKGVSLEVLRWGGAEISVAEGAAHV